MVATVENESVIRADFGKVAVQKNGVRWRETWSRHRWWISRILMLPVQIAIFATAAFFLVQLIPGDPVVIATGGRLAEEDYQAVRASLGLDQNLLTQLGQFLTGVIQLDFGDSIATGRPLMDEFSARIPQTLELVVIGMVGATLVSLLLAHLAVTRPGTWLSRVVLTYARTAGALPEFVIGLAAIFIFYASLHWVPAPTGRWDFAFTDPPRVTGSPLIDSLLGGNTAQAVSVIQHLALPLAVIVVAHSAILTKSLVNSLDSAIDEAPTKFRVATGAPARTVWWSVYRRALPTMVAMLGTLFTYMIGGAVVLESLFGLGGLGQYAVDAVNSADVFALRGFLVVVAAMSLIVFLLADILTMTLDIRRRSTVQGGA
ncbi:MAG: ABC transporter permease [Rhodococcus sp. (in: high G+C Gram-positive bacteria)]|uniref:ABC transporter permease n=1 Tax=Rhodococcus sp. TaxID=1831 RepID=UPI003BB161A6